MNDALSKKQVEVISMLGFGLSMKEIAAAEQVSVKVIEHRRAMVCEKLALGPYCLSDIVRLAIGFKLVSL